MHYSRNMDFNVFKHLPQPKTNMTANNVCHDPGKSTVTQLSCNHWHTAVMTTILPGCWKVFSPTMKETSSEACQGHAQFQQHWDTRCHQVFFFLQGKAPKEIHAILTKPLACFFPGRAKDLSASLYIGPYYRVGYSILIWL